MGAIALACASAAAAAAPSAARNAIAPMAATEAQIRSLVFFGELFSFTVLLVWCLWYCFKHDDDNGEHQAPPDATQPRSVWNRITSDPDQLRFDAAAARRRVDHLQRALIRWFKHSTISSQRRTVQMPLSAAGTSHYVRHAVASSLHLWRSHQLRAVIALASETEVLDCFVVARQLPPSLTTSPVRTDSGTAATFEGTPRHRRANDWCAEQQTSCAQARALLSAGVASRGRCYIELKLSLHRQLERAHAQIAMSRAFADLARRFSAWRVEVAGRVHLRERIAEHQRQPRTPEPHASSRALSAWRTTMEEATPKSHAHTQALRRRFRLWRAHCGVMTAERASSSAARSHGRRHRLRQGFGQWRQHASSASGLWVTDAVTRQHRSCSLRRLWRRWETIMLEACAVLEQRVQALEQLSRMRMAARLRQWSGSARADMRDCLLSDRSRLRHVRRRLSHALLHWAWRTRDERATHRSPLVHEAAMRKAAIMWERRARLLVLRRWTESAGDHSMSTERLDIAASSRLHRTMHNWCGRATELAHAHHRLHLATLAGDAAARKRRLSHAVGAWRVLRLRAVAAALRQHAARRLRARALCRTAVRRLARYTANHHALRAHVLRRRVPERVRKWAAMSQERKEHRRLVSSRRVRAIAARVAEAYLWWRRMARRERVRDVAQMCREYDRHADVPQGMATPSQAPPRRGEPAASHHRASYCPATYNPTAYHTISYHPIPHHPIADHRPPYHPTPDHPAALSLGQVSSSNGRATSSHLPVSDNSNASPDGVVSGCVYGYSEEPPSGEPRSGEFRSEQPRSEEPRARPHFTRGACFTTPIAPTTALTRRPPATQPLPSRAQMAALLRDKPLALATREEVRAKRRADAVAEGRVGGWAQSLRAGMYPSALPRGSAGFL